MARIVGGGGQSPSQTTGRPGFKQFVSGGIRRARDIRNVGSRGVTRLFAKNPADATFQRGGDIVGGFGADLNTNGPPSSPSVVRAPHDAATRTPKERVTDRSANRRLKER